MRFLTSVIGLVAAQTVERPIFLSSSRRVLTVGSPSQNVPVAVAQPWQPVPSSSSCDYYQDCWDCLNGPDCLWDPNALNGGQCKPASQCDFTVHVPVAIPEMAMAVRPPATACVRDVSQCGIQNFNGAPLDPNPQRGVGCTNSGQCPSGEYCVNCAQCNAPTCWNSCSAFNGYVSGYCAPASLCPINQDSIDNYCPGPVASNCWYSDCYSCAAASGCVWSGSYCSQASWPCNSPGCANDPSQCPGSWGGNGGWGNNNGCSYGDCQSCAAGYGCAWSGSYCYYSNAPCNTPGCANYPSQCQWWG